MICIFHFRFSSALSLASATSTTNRIAIVPTFLNSVYIVLHFFDLSSWLLIFLHDLSRSRKFLFFYRFPISMAVGLWGFLDLFFHDIFELLLQNFERHDTSK